ncbi:hypothetical protein JCM16814_28790 [Desulfobaculum senezii]|jgi:hypothetical protein
MTLYKTYSGEHFPKVYLVVRKGDVPEKIVPFNILYLFGPLTLSKGSINASHLPFAKGGQHRIEQTIEEDGYCFYKWPGKILGSTLGDVLEPLDAPPPPRSCNAS